MAIGKVLVATTGPQTNTVIPIRANKPITLGSVRRCHFSTPLLEGTDVHVHFVLRGAQVWVEPHIENPRVFLNKQPLISSTRVMPGDILQVGELAYLLDLRDVRHPMQRVLRMCHTLGQVPMHKRGLIRYPGTIIESAALTGLALIVVAAINLPQAGFFALFLASASLKHRFQRLLEENKHEIFVRNTPSIRANSKTAFSIIMIFIGICSTYLVTACLMSSAELKEYFGFIFQMTNTAEGTILDRNFGAFVPILRHNLFVVGTISALCLIYRSYGALLTLGWNACVWVIVLVTLTRPLLEGERFEQISISLWTFASVAPHLILEGSAYVFAALAAIFYSMGMTKYLVRIEPLGKSTTASVVASKQPSDLLFFNITMACTKLMMVSLFILVLAAFVEVFYATAMLSVISS